MMVEITTQKHMTMTLIHDNHSLTTVKLLGSGYVSPPAHAPPVPAVPARRTCSSRGALRRQVLPAEAAGVDDELPRSPHQQCTCAAGSTDGKMDQPTTKLVWGHIFDFI